MFERREQAGKLLIKKLKAFGGRDTLVLGIPRGGVIIAKVIASGLKSSLDIIVVRKIGAPDNPELAIGSVGPLEVVYWDKNLLRRINVTKSQISDLKSQKERERKDREKMLRNDKPYPNLKNKIVILVDDGVATGATCIAAVKSIKKMGPKKIILATPVIAKDTLVNIKRYFDEVVFLESPEEFYAVGQFYQEFPQVTDEEVIKLLATSD